MTKHFFEICFGVISAAAFNIVSAATVDSITKETKLNNSAMKDGHVNVAKSSDPKIIGEEGKRSVIVIPSRGDNLKTSPPLRSKLKNRPRDKVIGEEGKQGDLVTPPTGDKIKPAPSKPRRKDQPSS